ncbi:30S ribosomal protein S12 [Elysia marginata]|uniref:Small ribosomal subunit protein uS12m n=1 Tax=Elysia marginata TaxID=1093978 RepID=A0AAV4JTN3_9GAST|nr:30S ribosomal protein S12 [Elysia marginata]
MALFGLTRHTVGMMTQMFSKSVNMPALFHALTSRQFSVLANVTPPRMCLRCLTPLKPVSYGFNLKGTSLQNVSAGSDVPSRSITLEYMHRTGKYQKERRKKNSPLEGRPQLRGVVLKTLIKKPKKPNSANRKCVRLRLSTGREATAYVPGEGHNLQEHNVVLVQGGKLQDTPGVKLVCVRGKYDLPHVKKK